MQFCAALCFVVVLVAVAVELEQLFLLFVSEVLVVFLIVVRLVLLVKYFFYCLILLF